MKPVLKSIAVLTSGGDAPGMNAAIRAVVRAGIFYDLKIFGIYRGYDGLLEDDLIPMETKSVKYILSQGGTILKSARSKKFRTKQGRKAAFENLKKRGIDALVVIGGDGSFAGAQVFSQEFDLPVIGVPGTIDNDLYGTDNTIGFDSAKNTVLSCVDKIRDTAASHNRLFLIEVMGRDTGFIALHSGLASGALDIVLPEENQTYDHLFGEIEKGAANKKTSNIIIVAEGNQLGSTFEVAEALKHKYSELDIKVTILGHLQRGGAPTCADRILASQLGVAAVEALRNGRSNVMVGNIDNQIVYTPFEDAISKKAEINKDYLRISKILSI